MARYFLLLRQKKVSKEKATQWGIGASSWYDLLIASKERSAEMTHTARLDPSVRCKERKGATVKLAPNSTLS